MPTPAKTSYNKAIIMIALPAIFESLVLTFISMIDQKMVASLGTAAISAISVTNQPRLFILTFFTSIQTVLASLIAINLGKEDRDNANRLFITTLTVVLIGSLVLGCAAALAAKPIMLLCSGQEDTMEMSVTYFRILMFGTVFSTLYTAINAGLRGCGKTKVTFFSNLISCVVDIIFNYFLIEGHCGFPRLEIYGAAIATVIGFIAALIFSFIYLLTSDVYINLSYCIKRRIRPAFSALKEILSMWKHTFLMDFLSRVGMLISSAITARIGSFAMSIYSLGMNWMNVNFAFGTGFQAASVALVGKSSGANDKKEINTYSKKINRMSLITGLALGVIVILLAKPYYSIYATTAPNAEEFIRIGCLISFVVAVIAPIQVVKITQTGLLQGLGNMKLPMISAIISVTALQPICNAIFISWLHMGLGGVWLSVFLSQLCWMVTTLIFYNKARKDLALNEA